MIATIPLTTAVLLAVALGAVLFALGVRVESLPLVGIGQALVATAVAFSGRHSSGPWAYVLFGLVGAGTFVAGEAARVEVHRRRIPGPLRHGVVVQHQLRRDAMAVVALGLVAAAAVGAVSEHSVPGIWLPVGLLAAPALLIFVAVALRRAGQP